MVTATDTRFYVTDTPQGDVAVSLTLPTGAAGKEPIQMLRVSGLETVQPPLSPMTRKNFWCWRKSLKENGYLVELSFME